ncbi:CinA family protein [Agromyces sp. SYSU K20354]|uniref:CinA family protein n=1 Tax=Agromyces cavernae TaxID=2898659 RepID=UPI001E53D369|nr:CinA family protein [Agromyces cavernae]MCD2443762.1 CinA family protein [Agromyces cavernae]
MSLPRDARDGEAAGAGSDPAARLIAALTRRGLRIGVAESLTGGLLVAELIRIPGASAVVSGGVVAYDTAVKRTLLGVDAALLAREGAVHPEVARQMATGVRAALAVDGRPADLGMATTGVAGPDWQDGRAPGTVYLGIADAEGAEAIELEFDGDRAAIRAATVHAALEVLLARLEPGREPE